jgi:hypothetical protein
VSNGNFAEETMMYKYVIVKSIKLFKNNYRHVVKLLKRYSIIFVRLCFPIIFKNYFFNIFGTPSGVESVNKLLKYDIHSSININNPTPNTIHNIIHTNFFPERRFSSTFVIKISDGISTDTGYNLTKGGKLILPTSYEAKLEYYYPDWKEGQNLNDYLIWNQLNFFPRIHTYSETIASITSRYQSNYFHWIFDILPRINLIETQNISIDRIYVQCSFEFQKRTLNLLGYNENSIINSDNIKIIRANNLVVSSMPGIPGTVPTWACQFLREKYIPQISKSKSENINACKIYISRKKAFYRRVINEDKVEFILKDYGFISVDLNELDFLEQVKLFQHAKYIVAPHGAGLSNIVFCNHNVKVLELFSPEYINPCYWYLSLSVGLKYYYLLGIPGLQNKDKDEKQSIVRSDINIDENKLNKSLDLMMIHE